MNISKKIISLLAAAICICMTNPGICVMADSSFSLPEVGRYGMVPIYARDIKEGTYDINVDSSSRFFKVINASITVKGESIKGSIEIGSHSYLYVYMGTADQAQKASEKDYITPEEAGDSYIFNFDVKALNTPIDCAAYSRRKKKWYDRKLLFDAGSLEKGVLKIDLPDYLLIERGLMALENAEGPLEDIDTSTGAQTVFGGAVGDAYTPIEAMEVPYEDGEYSIEVGIAGGTGRASVSSPTLMIVKEGKAYAKLLWSSSHYDWMIVGGQTYYNENTDGGNSYFTVPIPDMDRITKVIADTTAMGDPVAIEYSLTYYADTIGNKGQIPQEAAKKVIITSAIVIIAGGLLNYIIKRKKKSGYSGSKKSGSKKK